tara:strand:- start:5660 stop:7096 length:1437 start_codon:yes stop_codon:yes gene_type:complete
MNLKNLFKYAVRFTFLQILITALFIWYFDNFLIINNEQKFNLYLNLVEDRDRFLQFFPIRFITVDLVLGIIVFLFLVILYSTKFYTYVNELDYSFDRNYIDEFIYIYLLWNSFLFSSFLIFRFSGLSRGYLLLFTFITPIILLIFRNSEILSSLLGRPVINEKYISFNLNENSIYRNLRIMAFRNEIGSYEKIKGSLSTFVINKIDEINKKDNLHLIVISLNSLKTINKELENYLININKKVLLISKNKLSFKSNFLFREEEIDGSNFVYFNNDIQYGAKYIIKRILDILISFLVLVLFSPVFFLVYFYILIKDGGPVLIRQDRVGLHGKHFKMFKYRTMKNNSHSLRKDLKEMNKKSGPLFKIDDDPRIIMGATFLRKYSLDELPQLFNVIKGDMSLVGPRPLFDTDTESFDKNYMRRLNVMPGMTGLLQINNRNADDFETWFKYDVEYIENWSLYLDIKILFKTIPSLFSKNIQGK